MTTQDIGAKLVAFCKAGKNHECMQELYSKDIVSVEAGAAPGQSPEAKGLEAVLAKGKWWADNHEVHSAVIEGPFPNGDRFAVLFDYDITRKAQNVRLRMREVAVYTVKDDKIVREEFFYTMG